MGVPMIVGGDEFMRTQNGNNNTYCQDNELNWYNWESIESTESQEMIRFWKKLIEKRKKYIDHFKGKYFTGKTNKFGLPDLSWHGTNLNNPDWSNNQSKCLAMTIGDVAPGSNQSENIHCMFNMHWDAVSFEIPQIEGLKWMRSIDTSLSSPEDIVDPDKYVEITNTNYLLTGRSVVVLVSQESG
jgi:glycogen operon protein